MTKNDLGLLLALGAALASAAGAEEPITLGKPLTLQSKVLDEDRTLIVYTPPGHDQGKQGYPVLYLTDGETQFIHTVATVEFLARNNLMPELIVVGITNTDRTRDLTPTKPRPAAGDQQNRFATAGGGDRFLKFIETEVVPHVEKTWRTRPWRMLCGHSLGGLFALHALFSRTELFDAVVAASPTLMWDNDLPLVRAHEFFAARSALKKTLVVTSGTEGPEMEQAFDEMQKILEGVKSQGFVSAAVRMPDEDHGSAVLRSYYLGLRKIFEGWRPPIDPVTGALPGGLDGVKRHYAALSGRFNYEIPPPEPLVNNVGYAELARGQTARALEAFRLNAATYPDSPNVHDSLGECLEADGKPREARDSYARAVALGEKVKDPNLGFFRQHLEAAEARLKAPGR